jgi:hypothetical protein
MSTILHYDKPCILTDQRLQQEFAIVYVAKHGDSKYNICLGNECACGRCMSTVIAYPSFFYNLNGEDGGILHVKFSLINSSISPPDLVKQQWILVKRLEKDKFCMNIYGKHHEVIKLASNDQESPLCSILTAKGTFHNAIDIDWPGFDGGNHKT